MKKLIFYLIIINLFIPSSWAGIEFDGVDDRINMADIAQIDAATALSCSIWVYHDVVTSDDTLIAKESGFNDGFLFIRDDVGVSRNDTYTIILYDSADTDSVRVEGAANASSATTWTHVAFTYLAADASGLRLYINGAEDANGPIDTTSIGGINAGTNTVRIGTNSAASGIFLDGKVDEAACWEATLTAAEVLNLAKTRIKRIPLQILPSNLIFYLPMDDGPDGTSSDGDTVKDRSAAGNNGTGVDGADNLVATWKAEEVLSYP